MTQRRRSNLRSQRIQRAAPPELHAPVPDSPEAEPDIAPRDLAALQRALGNAGRPDAASRLAAKAWWALRATGPREAERVNGVMHYLARLPMEPEAQPTEAPATKETA